MGKQSRFTVGRDAPSTSCCQRFTLLIFNRAMNGSTNENENEFVYFFITHHENRQWLYTNTFYHMPKNWRRPNEFDPQTNRKMAYKNGLRHTRSHTSPSVQYIAYWNLEVKHVKQLYRSITMDLSSDNLPCPPWLSLGRMSNAKKTIGIFHDENRSEMRIT